MTMTTRQTTMTRRLSRAALIGACLLVTSPVASAQGTFGAPPGRGGQGTASTTPTRPPRVENVDKAKTILHYAVGVGVIALCVGVVVIPGRRDHDE